MDAGIKAIETHWNGYRFRSRLEARWACFFEAAGISYRYEPEGYPLPSGWYLPDFFIPSLDCFVEIKGQEPTEHEKEMAGNLAGLTGKNVYIFAGDCDLQKPEGDCDIYVFEPYRTDGGEGTPELYSEYKGGLLVECMEHGQVGFYQSDPCSIKINCQFSINGRLLMPAYTAARQARFEHGEKPFIRKP